jgi:fused signal recognition particle receptor
MTMSDDPYTLLGIKIGVDSATIERAYQAKVEKLIRDASLSQQARLNALAALEEAYKRIQGDGAPAATSKQRSDRKRVAGVVFALTLVGGGIGYAWWQHAEQKRIQQEIALRERLEAERLAAKRAEEQRLREEQIARDREERRIAEEERLALTRSQREAEVRADKFVGAEPFVPRTKTRAELRDERTQRAQDTQDRVLTLIERRAEEARADREMERARAEVRRQQQYLDRQKYEEDLAAQQRARAARTR